MFAKLFASLAGGLWQYLLIALAVATAGLGVAYVLRGAQLTDARADIKVLEADMEYARRTIAAQQGALKECSDRTDALKAEGLKRQAEADKAVSDARKEAARYQQANQKRDAALKAPTPPGAGCREAVVDLRKGLTR